MLEESLEGKAEQVVVVRHDHKVRFRDVRKHEIDVREHPAVQESVRGNGEAVVDPGRIDAEDGQPPDPNDVDAPSSHHFLSRVVQASVVVPGNDGQPSRLAQRPEDALEFRVLLGAPVLGQVARDDDVADVQSHKLGAEILACQSLRAGCADMEVGKMCERRMGHG